ncbi:CFDP2 protein, partial [Acromyrmex charruanus]
KSNSKRLSQASKIDNSKSRTDSEKAYFTMEFIDFLGRERMYCMNTFFQKKPQKKWTWRSPDVTVKNEINYIFSSNKNICSDVFVLNRSDTGSDHRLVRACFRIDTRLEKSKLNEGKTSQGKSENQLKHEIRNVGSEEIPEVSRAVPLVYSTIDHFQAILVEKCIWAALEAMDLARIDSRYSNLIKYIYRQATLEVKINDDMCIEKIQMKRGVRQGDTISPKLFTLALEYVFKSYLRKEKELRLMKHI